MSTSADIFAIVATDAMALDPDEIRSTIMATHDRLPGGTQSSETGIRAPRMEPCTDPTCEHDDGWQHSHPIPNDPTGDAAMRPSKSEADLAELDAAVDRFVAAIGELASRSHSHGVPETWDEAVKDAHLLAEMDAVTVLERAGWKVRGWVVAAGDALQAIETLAGRHLRRDPNDHERSWTSGLADEQCCRVCLKLGLRVAWQDGGAGGLCQGCYRLRKRCAYVNELSIDEVGDPPETLIEELRRIGTPGSIQDRNARHRWFQRVGDEHRASRYCA